VCLEDLSELFRCHAGESTSWPTFARTWTNASDGASAVTQSGVKPSTEQLKMVQKILGSQKEIRKAAKSGLSAMSRWT
jgi:hypothetical protein